MLDADLAALYGVDVKVLNQAVKRNRARFPADFMFQLTALEARALRSQIVTRETGQGNHLLTAGEAGILRSQIVTLRSVHGRHRKYRPYAFTEQGVAMLSGVLHSPRAVRANVEIMRAFVRLRRMLATNDELARKLAELEARYDGQFSAVFEAIRELMAPSGPPVRRIGFQADES
jgi:hypothetical protein